MTRPPCSQAHFIETFLLSTVGKRAIDLSDLRIIHLAVQELCSCLGGAARSGAATARTTSFRADITDRGGPEHVGYATYIGELDVSGRLDNQEQLEAAKARLRDAANKGLIKHSVCENAVGVISNLFILRAENAAILHWFIHYVGMVVTPTKPTANRWQEEASPLDGTQLFPLCYAFPGSSWAFLVAISDSDYVRIFKSMRALAAELGVDCLDMFQLVCLGEALAQHYMCSLKRDGGANIMDCGVAICSTRGCSSPGHVTITSRAKSNWVAEQLASNPGSNRQKLWDQAGAVPLKDLLPASSCLLDVADNLQKEEKLPAGRAAPVNEFMCAINLVYSARPGCSLDAACPVPPQLHVSAPPTPTPSAAVGIAALAPCPIAPRPLP